MFEDPLADGTRRRATPPLHASSSCSPSPNHHPTCADAETLPGISEPFPGLFDPLNFLGGASVRDVRRWRESEIVHGRVSMLAALGFIVGENLEDFPAFYVSAPSLPRARSIPVLLVLLDVQRGCAFHA